MKKLANRGPRERLRSWGGSATQNTRVYDKFEYYLCDLNCAYCANYRSRGGHGCGRSKCEFQDLRNECIAAGRIKRKKGW